MTDTDAILNVWAATLDDVADTDVDRYRATLDARELDRVDRLRRDIDKRHYIAAHGILRTILGRYAGVDPAAIEFSSGTNGKPYLASPVPPELGARGPDRGGRIEFNMSDSNGLLLVAVAGASVGVDIEMRRPMDILKLARRFFTEAEADALEALPVEFREEAFFRTWTCKEAYVKGLGCGIAGNLDKFEVRVGESKSGLLRCALADDSPSRWSLVNIDVRPGFAAAVAIEQAGVDEATVRWWEK